MEPPPASGAAPAVCRGVFVTGTGTGVGKSVLAAAVCAALARRGERVAAFKPVVTGIDEPSGEWPADDELLASVASAGQSRAEIAPYRFGPAVAPHYGAELAGVSIEPERLVQVAKAAGAGAEALVCEGVGGLMVPLSGSYLVRDLALALGLRVVVAARTTLGTINHTLLTIESARAAGLRVAGVVLTPWPQEPTGIELSNRAAIERLGGVEVSVLRALRPAGLAGAGAGLPLADWLAA